MHFIRQNEFMELIPLGCGELNYCNMFGILPE